MAERRFVSHSGSVDDFIFSQENRRTLQKLKGMLVCLKAFLEQRMRRQEKNWIRFARYSPKVFAADAGEKIQSKFVKFALRNDQNR